MLNVLLKVNSKNNFTPDGYRKQYDLIDFCTLLEIILLSYLHLTPNELFCLESKSKLYIYEMKRNMSSKSILI